MLNDVYPPDQLPDFRLGAHPLPLRRAFVSQHLADSDFEERGIDTDQPLAPEHPPASDDLM